MSQPNRSRCLLLYTSALVEQMPKEDRYRPIYQSRLFDLSFRLATEGATPAGLSALIKACTTVERDSRD